MNAEVIKAMNRQPKKEKKFKKWWCNNGYKIMRIIFFPLWFAQLAIEEINGYLNNKNKWDIERATEILNYYIPRKSEWYDEYGHRYFYFFDNGYGWSIQTAKRFLKRKDRRFWDVHNGFNGGEIRRFLIGDFELEGFNKEVCDCSNGWTEIRFNLIKEKD